MKPYRLHYLLNFEYELTDILKISKSIFFAGRQHSLHNCVYLGDLVMQMLDSFKEYVAPQLKFEVKEFFLICQ